MTPIQSLPLKLLMWNQWSVLNFVTCQNDNQPEYDGLRISGYNDFNESFRSEASQTKYFK